MADRDWSQEEIDDDIRLGWDSEDDGIDAGWECGRWRNGRLSNSCSLAGTEQCDFECPLRNSLYTRRTSDG